MANPVFSALSIQLKERRQMNKLPIDRALILEELRELLGEAKCERLLVDYDAGAPAVSDIASELDTLIAKVDSGISALEGNVKKTVQNISPFSALKYLNQVRRGMMEIRCRVSYLVRSRRKSSKFLSEDDVVVVGLEKNIKELVAQLTKEGDACGSVVCIWGMGGIGKTTLALQIYHHREIRSHFSGFAWVTLSDNTWRTSWEDKHILMKILTQITNTAEEEIDESKSKNAIEYLYEKLEAGREKGKEYLVILDDIWRTQGIFIAQTLLSRFSNIKMLFTTRNKGVTSQLDASIFFLELRCLDKQQSWELFEKKANFERRVRDLEYNEMKELGEKMLQRCGGLPLAITMLGNLLSKANTIFEWQDIMFNGNLEKNTREDKTNKHGELQYSSWVLSLSYEDLPYYLRQCFLYLSHFPKDSEIRVNELCRMWSAESDLLLPRLWLTNNLEEQAYGFIDELVQRCMVQVEKLDLHGRIKTLRIHDLMRQLCLVKAEEEGRVKIINFRNKHEEVDALFYDVLTDVVPTYNPRRIAIYINKDVAHELLPLIKSVYRPDYLRSLICFNRLPYPSYEQVMKPLLKQFLMLRVLKFENLSQGYIGNLPQEIGELLSLRFLSLKGSHVEQVPSSIGNLEFLETLDLRTKWAIELPNVLWKLEQLRHLYLGHRSYISGNELMLGNLTSLQTLVNIPLMCCNLNDLKEMTQLRNLKLYLHAKCWKKFNSGGIVFHLLRSLAVENLATEGVDLTQFMSTCLQIEKLHLEGKIEKLPEDQYFPKLKKLTLNRTGLEDDPMTTLEKLPNLRFLLLNYNAFKGNKMVCSAGGFPRLESLSLVALERLKEWRVEKGALPNLSFLLIEYCYELEAIPDGLGGITNLKKLVLKRMPREFEMKVEESGKDFYKVQHVLHVEFLDEEDPHCPSEYKLSTFSPGLTTHPTNYSCNYVPKFSPELEIPDSYTKLDELVGTSDKIGLMQKILASPRGKVGMHKSRKKELEGSQLKSLLLKKGKI